LTRRYAIEYGRGMKTAKEVYDELRIEARDNSNHWDDLDYLTGFSNDEAVNDEEGEFVPWDALPETVQTEVTKRCEAGKWLER
jgi:hypothetical protein